MYAHSEGKRMKESSKHMLYLTNMISQLNLFTTDLLILSNMLKLGEVLEITSLLLSQVIASKFADYIRR